MDNDEYLRTQHELVAIALKAASLDLPAFIKAAETALAAGPVLEPTLWRAAHKKLEQVKELAEAVNRVRTVVLSHAKQELDEMGAKA